MRSFVVVIACLVALSLADDPEWPEWPLAFSASVFHTHEHIDGSEYSMTFYRWFYDASSITEQYERYDTSTIVDEEYATLKRYLYYTEDDDLEYSVTTRTDETECLYTDYINGTILPLPNFDMYSYMGLAYVNLVKCYHWRWEDQTNDYVEELWETADDERDPVLMYIVDNMQGYEDTIQYTEFDTCQNEDEDLFVIPDLILEVCTETKQ